jgi:hypothetical protein
MRYFLRFYLFFCAFHLQGKGFATIRQDTPKDMQHVFLGKLELLEKTAKKSVYTTYSQEGIALGFSHVWVALIKPYSGKFFLENPLGRAKLTFKYSKKDKLKSLVLSHWQWRANFQYYYYTNFHHAGRVYLDLGKSWTTRKTFFAEVGANIGYQASILPSKVYEVSDDYVIKEKPTAVLHYGTLGMYFMLGKAFDIHATRMRLFFRGEGYFIAPYNALFNIFYQIETGFSVNLYRKKIRK